MVAPGGCVDGGVPPLLPGACVSVRQRSFRRDVAPLFGACAGEVCHVFGGGAIASQIHAFSSECCEPRQMIEPFHPERSYVLQKLRGELPCVGSQMPLEGPAFDADALQIVADWICQGADTAQ